MNHSKLLKEAEIAERLGVSVMTLRKWRIFGKGPTFLKLGPKAVRYPEGELSRWIETRQRGGDAVEVA